MPAYRFQAADAAGVLHRGIVDADSSRQARAIIRERGQTPIEVVALSAEQNAGHINLGGRLKDADLALCTRQLSSLLTARLPLEKALNAVVEQAESARVRERFAAVRSDVVSGQTLTAAMAKFPRDFPDTYRALISAGEQSGDLAQVMSRLAAYVENRTQLVSKVKMAFTYPIIVAVVAVLAVPIPCPGSGSWGRLGRNPPGSTRYSAHRLPNSTSSRTIFRMRVPQGGSR